MGWDLQVPFLGHLSRWLLSQFLLSVSPSAVLPDHSLYEWNIPCSVYKLCGLAFWWKVKTGKKKKQIDLWGRGRNPSETERKAQHGTLDSRAERVWAGCWGSV